MSVPAPFTVQALKRRIDKQLSGDDALLAEILEAAISQAQEPFPIGCGRSITPEPAFTSGGADTNPPVTKNLTMRGRGVLVPDARVITQVEVDKEAVTEYTTRIYNGTIVRLELPPEHSASFYDWGGWGPPFSERSARFDEHRAPHTVAITGRFGIWPVLPDLLEAIYTLAARMYYEREAQYADIVQLAEGPGASIGQTYYRTLPPRTRLAFTAYSLPDGMAGLT
jgi:hypothetical protein